MIVGFTVGGKIVEKVEYSNPGVIFTKFRADKLYGPISADDTKPTFTSEYQVEIATRNAYYM